MPKIIYFLLILQFAQYINSTHVSSTLKTPIRLGAPTRRISGDHISLKFYEVAENGENGLRSLQHVLQNFVETLQKNFSTVSLQNTIYEELDEENNQCHIQQIYDLADSFEYSSELAAKFAQTTETFFEVTKNESVLLLMKLRQVPSAQRYLPTVVKMRLTDYFAEMEFFHVMFSEVIDQALEYIVDTLRSIQKVFIRYADIERDILRTWRKQIWENDWCCNAYTDFVQLWSTEIFKCAAGNDLNIAYDVYANTETTVRYIMRQLEFRIQRLYNCFIFGGYQIRCQFLLNPEHDFQLLFAKLDELQQYFDIKIKRGRVTMVRYRRGLVGRMLETDNKCIPPEFPGKQMANSLKSCFYFQNSTFNN